jgi:endonuclease/exonuclease/phosphatase family metal-dependent hydrolase
MTSHVGIVVTCLLLAGADWALSAAETTELRVLTFNILHGANADGELNLEAKGEFVVRQAVDLAFLQEIDEKCERSRGVDQMAVLGRITGMAPAFGAFMPYQGGRYGLGTLSALPVVSIRELRLPDGGEPRVALFSEVEVLGRPLLAVNVHFDWIEDDSSRYAQARALLTELATIDLPMIVAGDFNDAPESRTMRGFFEAGFSPVEALGATWNARAPSVDIDHILVRSGRGLRLEPLGGEVLDERTLSDHRPVLGRVVVHRR